MGAKSFPLTPAQARAIWLRAQRLDAEAPFGEGPEATRRAVAHLGYVQIDTINVIERSHHHILHSRIPGYSRTDLEWAQSTDKSVFEYWTHALSYVPTADYRFFIPAMERLRQAPNAWLAGVDPGDYAALLRRIRREGALSIRDIGDEVLVEKTHPWASRKPSKRVLRLGFFIGDLTISKRSGMLKSYELAGRHFGWLRRPRPATEAQIAAYLLDRAVRSQGIVSLDSICFGNLASKAAVSGLVETAVRRKRLLPVRLDGHAKIQHWAPPAALDTTAEAPPRPQVHILSPFDPLVIQRKRLNLFFGYEHRFEAYVPAAKRVLGYFALPVLMGDEVVAAIDLKADRQARKLLVQKWTWIAKRRAGLKPAIEEAMARFEQFQLS
ncbi:winged helix-turn-helix domain-containing protein [Plastoroseomonas hellenica]|uniref:winged helix-turn-helix domain-containing protein n=1 Tax=Plastoroseomonas hellenica TaxID=2687306 RepID=UPI001BAE535A|nr:crosslink repair DNA glycosylase YcaQ family protein [Plastoroseomonas hellenica]MBR0642467.1 winged helix-turn-helix domain-containing protein [Plastoroseomonas hellenica]